MSNKTQRNITIDTELDTLLRMEGSASNLINELLIEHYSKIAQHRNRMTDKRKVTINKMLDDIHGKSDS